MGPPGRSRSRETALLDLRIIILPFISSLTKTPDLNQGSGKCQSERNQATERKLHVGKLDSRADLGCLTSILVHVCEESQKKMDAKAIPLLSDVHEGRK